MQFSPDVTQTAREAGRAQGRMDAVREISDAFAAFAISHPDPVVCDELWTFINYLRKM
jgi:hypothetical protein